MDLLSSIRKEGSRGGVNFQWSDVASSSHRENYLGHSLMAPVGRWQKGKDLNWYAKADDKNAVEGETDEEKAKRLRMEEIRAIKEQEEDALNKALGLPPKDRSANAMPLGGPSKMDEIEVPKLEEGETAQYKGLGARGPPTEIGSAEPEKRRKDAGETGLGQGLETVNMIVTDGVGETAESAAGVEVHRKDRTETMSCRGLDIPVAKEDGARIAKTKDGEEIDAHAMTGNGHADIEIKVTTDVVLRTSGGAGSLF